MKFKKTLRSRAFAMGCVICAAILTIGGAAILKDYRTIREASNGTADPELTIEAQQEETPLASAPKVTTNTTKNTKTSKKKVTLKKASTKTYTKKLPTTKKVTTKTTKKDSKTTVKKVTTVQTATSEKYTKKSKTKLVTKKVTTTVKTTTTVQEPVTTATATVTSTANRGKYEVNIRKIAPRADSRILSAFEKLGFKVYIDSSVNYAGYMDPQNRTITLRNEDDVIYHELGHFLAVVAGNYDKGSSFMGVYNAEKNKYTGNFKNYVTQNSEEYFAESVREYVLEPGNLKASRPQTYNAITTALSKVTDTQISRLLIVYSVFWK